MGYGRRVRRIGRFGRIESRFGRPGRRIRIHKRRAAVSLLIAIAILVGAVMALASLFYHMENRPTKLREEVDRIGDIPIIADFIPKNTMERPGDLRKIKYIVIHETGNAGKNADAASHNHYLHASAEVQQKSWHYTVDGNEIYYHIPDNEIAFHAGDGLVEDGGNRNGIGIEMCINPENDYEQTLRNTAKLTAMLLTAYDLPIDRVKKHQDFSGKHCPANLLDAGRWDEFVDMVRQELSEQGQDS